MTVIDAEEFIERIIDMPSDENITEYISLLYRLGAKYGICRDIRDIVLLDSPLECIDTFRNKYYERELLSLPSGVLYRMNRQYHHSRERNPMQDKIEYVIFNIYNRPMNNIFFGDNEYVYRSRFRSPDHYISCPYDVTHIMNSLNDGVTDENDVGLYISTYLRGRPYFAICFDDLCIASRYPTHLHLDRQYRLHSSDRHAIEWGDSTGYYFIHGNYITDRIYQDIKSGDVNLYDIFSLRDDEVRSILLKLIDYEKYLDTHHVGLIDVSSDVSRITESTVKCSLYEVGDIPCETDVLRHFYPYGMRRISENKIKVVSVEDHTTHEKSVIYVPSYMMTVREAIAWTFNMEPYEYRCTIES